MSQVRDPRKEHRLMVWNSSARLMGERSCWSLLAATLLLCAGPTWSQTRTHNPKKPATSKTPAPTNPTPPAGTNPTPPSTTAPSTTKPPASQPTPPTPTPTPPAGGSAGIATASDSMRGLLIAVDASGKITLARNAYPPLPMKVAAGAVITRDGAPARLSDLETGSR